METTAPSQQLPPPFIAEQGIQRLALNPQQRLKIKDYLGGKIFTSLRGKRATKNDDSGGEVAPEDFWVYEDRFECLATLKYPRMVITVDGGYGKSTAIDQLVYLRSVCSQSNTRDETSSHLVIKADLVNLPTHEDYYLSRSEVGSPHPFLVDQVNKQLQEAEKIGDGHPSFQLPGVNEIGFMIRDWIEALLTRGQFTLIVDGLDQTGKTDGKARIDALQSFLKNYPSMQCVVAGRPNSIQTYWHLFSGNKEAKHSNWEFFKIPEFSSDQVARYVGAERFSAMQFMQADSLFVPRTLEVIRLLDDEQFASCQTAADIYWESVCETLNLDFEHHRKKGLLTHSQFELDQETVIDLFSAMAFVLLQWNKDDPETQIPPGRQREFNKKFLKLLRLIPYFENAEIGVAIQVLKTLAEINSQLVQFAFMGSIEGIDWRNPTLRDFFAALWIVRCSTPDQRAWLATKTAIVDRSGGDTYEATSMNIPYLKVWQFVCQMSPRAWQNEACYRQLDVFRKLFAKRTEPRPTELMYHAWPQLLVQAGKLDESRRTDAEIESATTNLQREIQAKFTAERRHETNHCAEGVLWSFLSEYLDLKQGGNTEVLMLEESLSESKVKTLPAGPSPYYENYDALERAIEQPYRMSAYQVWNDLYGLFDPHHKERFGDYKDFSPYGLGACIYKTWYDSWLFAVWSHSRLAYAHEWESACRPDRSTDDRWGSLFCFGNDATDLCDYAWFDENSHLPNGAKKRSWHAHEVGKLKNTTEVPLYDLHGNVWEWALSRAATNSTKRFLKGGSFCCGAESCTIASNELAETTSCREDYGFRVARNSN
jgi:Sulfatase-modifying factor enzyme 1